MSPNDKSRRKRKRPTPVIRAPQEPSSATRIQSSRSGKRQPPRLASLWKHGASLRGRKNPLVSFGQVFSPLSAMVGAVLLSLTLVFAFWPTWVWLEHAWRTEPDYSHGYLVIPLAAILLWMRRETFPGIQLQPDWRGLSLIAVGIAMRLAGSFAYMDFMDGWSLLPMVAGAVWLLLGFPALRWAAPAILFLIMLVPLPYRLETMLSWKLQGIAAQLSTIMLRILGNPAVVEGHTIWIGDIQLFVEQACSGLRTFVGVFTLAFFWAATVKRAWLDCAVVLLAALPCAILVNALRITVTGVLFGWTTDPEFRHFIHDWTGYLMTPLAAALLWGVKLYWEHFYRPVVVYNSADRLRGELSNA